MKTMRISILCFVVLLFVAPLLRAQELSKYRHFAIGMSLPRVLERTEQRMTEVKAIHDRPALIQELDWWPPNLTGSSSRADIVERIVFSFYNGQLYKISVTYDRASTEGLTAQDMVTSISAKYGPATNIVPQPTFDTIDRYDMQQRPVASWEDSEYSFTLVRSSFTDRLGLSIYSKRVDAQAELAIAEAVKLDEQEGPKREARRQKQETDNLEVTRQKNRKVFRP
jgi:hypothetical protein